MTMLLYICCSLIAVKLAMKFEFNPFLRLVPLDKYCLELRYLKKENKTYSQNMCYLLTQAATGV